MCRFAKTWCLLLLLAVAAPLRADLILTVGNASVSQGGTGSFDVFLRSDTGTDVLDIFQQELRITTGSGHRLEFVKPPLDSQLTDPAYLFYGNSFASFAPPAGSISSVNANRDTYIGGDGTFDTLDVTVPTTNTLLAHILVTAATSNAPLSGDTFSVSLIGGDNTFFYEPSPSFAAINYTSSPGTINITGTLSAVPEPSSLALVTAVVAGLGVRRFRSRSARKT